MREHERPVGEREDVELDHVHALLDRPLERANVFSGASAAAPRCPIPIAPVRERLDPTARSAGAARRGRRPRPRSGGSSGRSPTPPARGRPSTVSPPARTGSDSCCASRSPSCASRRGRAHAAERLRQPDHEVVEPRAPARSAPPGTRRERARELVDEPVSPGTVGDVERDDPAGREPLRDELEELLRREVERHVRLVVGVDEDQVVALVRAAQERPRVRVVTTCRRGLSCRPR